MEPTPEKPPILNIKEIRRMYEIPGQGEITNEDLERYEKDKAQDALIRDVATSFDSLSKINSIPKGERADLIRKALEDPDINVRLKGAEMIWHAPEGEQEELKKIFLTDKELVKRLVQPPLYNQNPEINGNEFFRRQFEKTGSETILLGDKLKGKLILRRIKPNAFLVWQRLYENYDLWQQNGFDYVPIEPIQSYRLNKDGLVDVFSGVLDANLEKVAPFLTTETIKHLYARKDEIERIIENSGIKHGHPHGRNFCLRFFRDENGGIDMTKPPRIYLIDFDRAISEETE